jgi:hypothetical protein
MKWFAHQVWQNIRRTHDLNRLTILSRATPLNLTFLYRSPNIFQLLHHYFSKIPSIGMVVIHNPCQNLRTTVNQSTYSVCSVLTITGCKEFATAISELPENFRSRLRLHSRPLMYGGDFFEMKYVLHITLVPQLNIEVEFQFQEQGHDYEAYGDNQTLYTCNTTIEMR